MRENIVITLFLTMLVGAGGNAGNQSAIRVIRGLATGEMTPTFACFKATVWRQARVGLLLATGLGAGGFARVLITELSMNAGASLTASDVIASDVAQQTPVVGAAAIATSLFVIVTMSTVTGSAMPFALAAAGQDPDMLLKKYAWMMNEAIKDRPDDMVIGMHMCRGNFQSTYAASGGYDPAAEAIFSTGVDIFFMEYDSDRAGGLEPLRLLPKGKQRVMAGFVTTKTPGLESVDELKRKFDEASQYVDMDQLGLAPQCGFSSTEHGNKITMDDQRRKLDLVVKTAEEIWGEA